MSEIIKKEIVSMIKVSTTEDVKLKIQELKDECQYYEDNRNGNFTHSAHEYYNMIPTWIEGLKDYLIEELNQNKEDE